MAGRPGHVPNARHIYVPHLEENLAELDQSKPIAAYCGSGYRASIAASILKKKGFEKVINIPGSWNAWTAVNLPVETDHKKQEKLGEQKKAGEIMNFHIADERKIINLCAVKKSL